LWWTKNNQKVRLKLTSGDAREVRAMTMPRVAPARETLKMNSSSGSFHFFMPDKHHDLNSDERF
jgi:hypothetical protein